jgi:hypothetical protein
MSDGSGHWRWPWASGSLLVVPPGSRGPGPLTPNRPLAPVRLVRRTIPARERLPRRARSTRRRPPHRRPTDRTRRMRRLGRRQSRRPLIRSYRRVWLMRRRIRGRRHLPSSNNLQAMREQRSKLGPLPRRKPSPRQVLPLPSSPRSMTRHTRVWSRSRIRRRKQPDR